MAETDAEDAPFHGLGNEARVRELAARFYDRMERTSPRWRASIRSTKRSGASICAPRAPRCSTSASGASG
jgi:hypothetical protein